MNHLKRLDKKHIAKIAIILILIITSLWVWEKYDRSIQRSLQTEAYNKLLEENELLRNEVKNINKQNRLLYKVLELKKELE